MLFENETGYRIPIYITKMNIDDVKGMRPNWTPGFNWRLYFQMGNVEVYKICVVGSDQIEGAIALENRGDHEWIHLIEKAPHNRGVREKYKYVAHHLFAYAAQRHIEQGGDGFVAYEAKSGLIHHYVNEYGAVSMGSSRMFIPNVAGHNLIRLYLN
ncbi:hypothetical protein [Paenibacillus sp. Leaf72]|uniref:hypothetical protein n=1 Tax=Paenibacillus sp. Leaf72 TaxID=1736234 RepID=UPI0006F2E765|nr:hypothetical protein [Paenibacillus sp. Leaf72]KQN98990.1 hypothetical protein ASF12_19600 [Paenibacillus sp. Leaf72]